MHVLITADTVGGVWTYTRELVGGLVQRGHQVTLVSFGGKSEHADSAWIDHVAIDYYATDYPLEWMEDSVAAIDESVAYVQNVIERTHPDIAHFNQFCYGGLPCDIPKVVVAHSDVVSWWSSVYGCTPPESTWSDWYRRVVVNGLNGADIVIAPSQWQLQTIHQLYDNRVCGAVIYNGRSPESFQTDVPKQPCMLTVGRLWDKGKQVSLLLARQHSTPIRIAGNPEHPSNGTDAIRASGDSNIIFHGQQTQDGLRALYAESAAYVATSCYEPFGLAPLEAAFSSCALILNDIPVFREIWKDAAFYFGENDADSLAMAIRRLSNDQELREEYAKRAYTYAVTNYTANRMVLEYEQLYQALLRKKTNA